MGMNLNDFRKKIPQLEGLDDEAALNLLHEVYYPDADKARMATALGVKITKPEPVRPQNTLMGFIGDRGLDLVKGAVAVPEAAVGVADLVSGGAAGRAAEEIGFRPREAKEILSGMQSDAYHDRQAQFQAADGIVAKTGVALTNPSLIAGAVTESLPLMAVGGVVGRGVMAAAPKLASPAVAGALGEGAVAAGSTAEQVRQQTADGYLTPKQAVLSAAAGVGTAAFGYAGAKAAKAMGIADLDTALVQGSMQAARDSQIGVIKRVAGGMFAEGVLEELPQSVVEQMAQNIALDKPLMQDVDSAIVMGALSGAAMGGGAALLSRPPTPTEEAADTIRANKVPEAGTLSKAVNVGIEESAKAVEATAPAPSLTNFDPATMIPENPLLAGARVRENDSRQEAMTDQAMAKLERMNAGDMEALNRGRFEPSSGANEIAPPTEVVEPAQAGDILNPQGAPFKNKTAATRAQKKAGGEIVKVAGGWAVRGSNVSTAGDVSGLDTGTPGAGPAEPAPGVEAGVGTGGVDRPALDAGGVRDPADGGAVPLDPGATADAVTAAGGPNLFGGLTEQESGQEEARLGDLRRQLVDIENRIVGAAGLAPDFIEQAMQSRKVPKELKDRRNTLREQLREGRGRLKEQQAPAKAAAPAKTPEKIDDFGEKPKTASKDDAEHLFGVPAKRERALKRIANGKAYFGNAAKAKDFIKSHGLAETHEAVQNATTASRWDVVEKAAEKPTSGTPVSRHFTGQPDPRNTPPMQTLDGYSVGDTVDIPARTFGRGKVEVLYRRELAGMDPSAMARVVRDDGKKLDVLTSELAPVARASKAEDAMKTVAPLKQTLAEFDKAWVADHMERFKVTEAQARETDPKTLHLDFIEEALEAGKTVDPRVLEGHGLIDAKEYPLASKMAGETRATIPKNIVEPEQTKAVQLSNQEQQAEKAPESQPDPVRDQTVNVPPTVAKAIQDTMDRQKNRMMRLRREAEAAGLTLDEKKTAQTKLKAAEAGLRKMRQSVFQVEDAAIKAVERGVIGELGEHADLFPDVVKAVERLIDAKKSEPAPTNQPKDLDAQLAELNAELDRQGAVQNANTRARRDSIREQIAERDYPEILEAVDGEFNVAEELHSAFQYAGDEPKATTIARVLNKRGITPEYQKRWTERLLKDEKPAPPPEPKAEKPGSADELRAKADLQNALADLADILTKGTRMYIVPPDEQKLLPVLTRVMDAAFRLGYIKFKQAARFALDEIRKVLGSEAADQITLDHLQGAYIAMAGKYQSQGADKPKAVTAVDSLDEITALEDAAPAKADGELENSGKPADTGEKDSPNDSPAQGSSDTLDNPLAAGPAGKPAVARGARVPRRKPGRADAGELRDSGGLFENLDDEGGNLGDSRRDAVVPDRPDDALAGNDSAVSAPDYRAPEGSLTRKGSWYDTAARNIDLIEMAIAIEAEGRPATPDEQEKLAKYVGFGAGEIRNKLFPVPNSYAKQQEPDRLIWPDLIHDARWKALAERMDKLPREWQKSVLQSTQYAHYTSEGVIRSIWTGVQRMGFTGGKVLEPGSGIGSFAMLMPDSARKSGKYTGIEFDGPTALIARLLSPQQNMLHADFIKRKLPRDFFDLAIGNPPFSQTKILGDPDYAKRGFMLHDFFFAKSLDRVRPGGLLVFVTSKGTMDKQSDKARKYLSDRADLMGAIRLPQTAFEENAGTKVVTDIIFLRKRAPGEAPAGPAWNDVKTIETKDGPAVVNEYFAAHPEMVLGQQRLSGNQDDEGRRISGLRGIDKYTVVSYDKTPAELEAKIAKAVESLPENVYSVLSGNSDQVRAETAKVDFDPKVKREGVLYLGDNNQLMRVQSGVGRPLADSVKLSDKDQAWYASYIEVRDLVQEARAAQVADGPWEAALKKLNAAYDAFRKKHGPINDFRVQVRKSTDEDGNEVETEIRVFKNRRLYREDYDASVVTQLETINEAGEVVKAPFLLGRTIGKPVVREVKSVGDALAVSLDELGRLDLDDIGRRMKLPRAEVIEALGTQIYQSPAGQWQLADEYLSGDVVGKLEEAEEAARVKPSLARNVEALKAVQPEKLGPSQISVKLGASWVPADYVTEFAKEIGAGAVKFDTKTESWQVEGGNLRSQRTAGAEYGTADRSPSELLEAALNSRTVTIKKRTEDKKEVTDADATAAAAEAIKKIREKFKSWIWTDSDRASELVEIYNTRFNNIAPRRFDGDHLTLPGVSLRFKLHPHQLRAIWRQIQTGDTYLAHAVGAGKTIEMIAGGMEQKRLGLIKKPMYVVPNHMLEQFANEFMELYPLANIMVADDENFSAERRRAFVAAATLNAPDAIVITHSAFERIGVKEETVAPIRDEILLDLETELEDADKGDRVRRSQLEQQIEAVTQRFDRIVSAGGKDSTIKFEDIGADYVYVDEAHVYRKLDFSTNQKLKGIDPNGSKRALDMYVKTRYLRKQRPERAMTFASGTPVTNTMGELYTIMRFFAPDELDRAGIATFDGWARQFGESVAALEANAAGRYEVVERFAKFDNVPELMSRIRQFMDVLTSESLGSLVKRPDVEGGKPNLVMVEGTPELKGYMKTVLLPRLEASRRWKPSKDEPFNPDPVIAITSDGRFAALDPRFFGAKVDDTTPTKLNAMADAIAAEYKATAENVYQDKAGGNEPVKGSTQIVFYNLGFGAQSQQNRGFDARGALNKRLTAAGVKREHIAWFDDADTDAKKEAIFKGMRAGQIRVLIGSAKKMGTGVNVQKRLSMLHYFDPPWFPSDVEQPHGRIIRQGNQNEKVRINWYATKGTYDSTMWQMVARKQRFIDQAFTGDKSVRSMDDMSEASQYEQAAAMASGDPRALQLAGLRQDVERMERLQSAHASEQIAVRSELRSTEWRIENTEKRIKTYGDAFKALGERYISFTTAKVGNATFTRLGEFGQALKDAFNKGAADHAIEPAKDAIQLGSIEGLPLAMYQDFDRENKPSGIFELVVDVGGYKVQIASGPGMDERVDAVGLGRRVVNGINEIDRDLRVAKSDLIEQQNTVKRLRKKMGAPFEYQQELAEKYGELKRLEEELKAEGEAEAKAAASAVVINADGSSGPAFSRYANGGGTLSKTQIQRAVDKLTLNWLKKPDIHILDSMDDAPDPVRRVWQSQDSKGARGKIEGFHYKGGVYIVADAMESGSDIIRVLFHESLGHFGLRNVFGTALDGILKQIAVARPADMRRKATQYGFDLKNDRDRMAAAEELLAEMAQTRPEIGFVQRAIAAIRTWLRENVPYFRGMELSDDEIVRNFLEPARGFVERGIRGEESIRAALAFSKAFQPVWYSALQNSIEAVNAKAAPAAGWAQTIDGLVKAGKVKADEVEWSGITDWLKLQTGKVTKQQVLDYLDANGVRVEEVVLGDAPVRDRVAAIKDVFARQGYTVEFDSANEEIENLTDPDGESVDYEDLPEDLQTALNSYDFSEAGSAEAQVLPKFNRPGLVLPGGENYREVLLTLPTKKQPLSNWTAKRFGEATGADYEGWQVRATMPTGTFSSEIGIEVASTAEQAIEAAKKDAAEHYLTDDSQKTYRSSHWDTPNVLAHLRLNDRTDADGKRVLFVEEIQSDWGQEGKKKGFGGGVHKAGDKFTVMRNGEPRTVTAMRETVNGLTLVEDESGSRFNVGSSEGVPTAPFVTNTDKWLTLALKRVITMAAQEGYDRVAFVNGEQSAERYDLSKQVKEITVGVRGDERFVSIDAERGEIADLTVGADGVVVRGNGGFEGKSLADVIGKELADRIMSNPEPMRLRGVDLKVGGEGMKAFYDTIVPNTLKALLKKVGGGQLETTGIVLDDRTNTRGGWHITPPDQTVSGKWMLKSSDYNSKGLLFDTEAEARAALAEKQPTSQQPSFTITPAMREKVAGGLPLFSRQVQGKDQTDTPAFKKWFGDSKVVDADGKPLVVYHGTTRGGFTVFKVNAASRSEGFVFTSNRGMALTYSGQDNSAEPGPRSTKAGLYEVFLSIQNPKVIDWGGDYFHRRDGKLTNDAISEAKAEGYDGLIIRNVNDPGGFALLMQHRGAVPSGKDVAGDLYVAFSPEQIKSAIGNRGTFDPNDADIRFSRAADLRKEAAGQVVELFHTATNVPGRMNWWHKTVGTMYNLAQRSPEFKRVFSAVQAFIDDTAYYADRAARLAPNILPKLETWRDVFKSPMAAEDNRAIRAPIFEGTLVWMRDESGKPVKAEDVRRAAEDLTVDQKAQRLLRNDFVTAGTMRMWRGLPMEQYESIIEGSYERHMLRAGIVFTPDELKRLFKLTDGQVKLYQEFRRATDMSLTNLSISEMVNLGGHDTAPVRQAALDSEDVVKASAMLRDHLLELADADAEKSKGYIDAANKIIALADKAKDLMDKGYAPLSRFGHYTVDVVGPDGTREYFGMFESRFEAAKMAGAMAKNYPDARIERGTVSEEAYKLFAGVTPETLELFGEILGLDTQGDGRQNQAFKAFVQRATANRSAMKRLLERKGIAGFSEDAGRVLAGFVFSNGRRTASNLHGLEMKEAAEAIPKQQGELKDHAVALVEYVQNPQEEAQGLRGLLFTQYIGGIIASAIVNMTQPITMSLPYLSQFGGITQAAKQMARAAKDVGKTSTGDKALDAAMTAAEEKGIVSPQEVHQLQQQAAGRAALQVGDGTMAGDARAKAGNALSKTMLAWGKLFSAAEQFNRRVTFIAAYRTAVDRGIENPAKFAEDAVIETQGLYNKGNKPKWARGAIGSTLFTFKQYSVAYVEMLGRLAKSGPEGRRAALYALAILFMLSGAGGLPGAEDLDDLISGLMQKLGYNFNSKSARRAFFAKHLGQAGADFVERGVSGLAGVPIDISGRMGLGNLIPGTGLLTKKTDHTSDVAELAGPAGDLAKRAFQAGSKAMDGDLIGKDGAVTTLAPLAVRNLSQAADMAKHGMYRDARGRKVVETDQLDALSKAFGFQPNDVKRVQDATREVQQMISLNKIRESEIADQWAKALFERDKEGVQEARDALKRWNADNPDSTIRISMQQINKRLANMRMGKEDRLAKTASKEIRATVRRELEAAR